MVQVDERSPSRKVVTGGNALANFLVKTTNPKDIFYITESGQEDSKISNSIPLTRNDNYPLQRLSGYSHCNTKI